MSPLQKLSTAFILSTAAMAGPAIAAEIYQWIDDEGVVHFSDAKPARREVFKTLYVDVANPPGYEPSEDPYSILNQAKRTNLNWTEFDKERQQRKEESRQRAERYAPRTPRRIASDPYYRPAYFYAPLHRRNFARNSFSRQNRQFARLDELGLTAPRTQSINSSAHHARVVRSNDIRTVVSRPQPRRR